MSLLPHHNFVLPDLVLLLHKEIRAYYSGMTITLLSGPPTALSREELASISTFTPSTFEGIAPLTRHHEPNGVKLRLEPAFEGFNGQGLEGGLWITEG